MGSVRGNSHAVTNGDTAATYSVQGNTASASTSQGHTSTHSWNVDAREFVPRGQPTADCDQSGHVWSAGPPIVTANLEHLGPIQEMQQVIYCLTYDPGSFDLVMEPLADSLYKSIDTEATLLEVIDMLIAKSIHDSNFRYTGARICHYLSQHLDVKLGDGNFRQQLLKRCHTEHIRCKKMVGDVENEATVIGFTLFLSELLANLTLWSRRMQDVENNRLSILAKALLDMLRSLITAATDGSLKCVSQVLKMTGAIMEEMSKSEDSLSSFDSIFGHIKTALVESNCQRNIKDMLLKVLELRANKWGQIVPDAGDYSDMISDVMYAGNEQMVPIPAHPDEFAGEGYDAVNGGGDWPLMTDGFYVNDDYEYVDINSDIPIGMDDEMEAAYEEFLRETESQQT